MNTHTRPFQSIRSYLDALILLQAGGLLAELALIDHYENTEQILPIISAGGICILIVLLFTGTIQDQSKLFATWMLLTALVGVVGVGFHAYGNYEFAKEIYPGSTSSQLFLKTIKGATPLLAPGAMIGLGLLGLLRIRIIKLYNKS